MIDKISDELRREISLCLCREEEDISDDVLLALYALQQAVDEEMERKAKLGYSAVVADENGRAVTVPAEILVRRRRENKARYAREHGGE